MMSQIHVYCKLLLFIIVARKHKGHKSIVTANISAGDGPCHQ